MAIRKFGAQLQRELYDRIFPQGAMPEAPELMVINLTGQEIVIRDIDQQIITVIEPSPEAVSVMSTSAFACSIKVNGANVGVFRKSFDTPRVGSFDESQPVVYIVSQEMAFMLKSIKRCDTGDILFPSAPTYDQYGAINGFQQLAFLDD